MKKQENTCIEIKLSDEQADFKVKNIMTSVEVVLLRNGITATKEVLNEMSEGVRPFVQNINISD